MRLFYSNLEKIRTEASWSEERQIWRLPDLTVQKTKLPPAGKSFSWQSSDRNVARPHCEKEKDCHLNFHGNDNGWIFLCSGQWC